MKISEEREGNMIEILSTDWINKFIEVLNSDDAYAERAKHFSGLISS